MDCNFVGLFLVVIIFICKIIIRLEEYYITLVYMFCIYLFDSSLALYLFWFILVNIYIDISIFIMPVTLYFTHTIL